MIDAKSSGPPPLRDLVLVGGGHSHVQVIRRISMKQIPGVRVTLISEDYESSYSGMLPGCVANIYTKDQISIQLSALCSSANVRFICAEVTELDPTSKRISLRGRSPVRYDTLSINTGGSPGPNRSIGINVKPINLFLPRWQAASAEISAKKGKKDTLCIVGAGAGGVELAFAMRASLPPETKIKIFGSKVLPGHGDIVERRVLKVLAEKKIDLIRKYFETDSDYKDGNEHIFWVTGTESPAWIKESGLCLDDRGFIKVNRYLQSLSHSNVFAAGDAAHLTDQERDKAGVYAVRAGPYLFRNLSKAAQGIPSQFWSRYKAQGQYLILLGCGDGTAIAIRNGLALRGRVFWRLKDWIDRVFIRKFNELPKMGIGLKHPSFPLAEEMPDMDMRCGGCGAKIAAEPLRRVLDRLPKQPNIDVRLGIGDDAAIIKHSGGESLISVDGFRSMIEDAYKFGRITAHHSMNDLFAMGGRPTGALAFVTLPVMSPELIEEDLFQILSGVLSVLKEHQASLVGGHSAEGADLSLALTVVGEPGSVSLVKSGSVVNDQFILTKPLGTGVLLAGAMRREV
ncbi:MAG: selenide, water dikinase SelD, partial [Gammaproteobacteria bacterium]|nr:selenide, water dikinase SelD [Gammaproteobacteria bacterium]